MSNLIQIYILVCYMLQTRTLFFRVKSKKTEEVSNMDLLMLLTAPITMTNVLIIMFFSTVVNLEAPAFRRR
jgi:hypothetical protein